MNNCTFIGTVSDEPRRSTTKTGKPMMHLTLHVRYGTGDWQKSVYVPIQAFSRVVDSLPYLDKGSFVAAVCDYGSYKDEAGNWKGIFTARELLLLDNAPQHKGQATSKPKQRNDGFSDPSDLPF